MGAAASGMAHLAGRVFWGGCACHPQHLECRIWKPAMLAGADLWAKTEIFALLEIPARQQGVRLALA